MPRKQIRARGPRGVAPCKNLSKKRLHRRSIHGEIFHFFLWVLALPLSMDVLTETQKLEYKRIKNALRSARHIGELDEDLLTMAACLAVEVRELQSLIDEKGYTYEFKNRDGGTMTKHRPEHQMLVESRSKYLVVLKELGMTPAARKRIEVEVEMDDELEQLLTFKDA